MTSIVRRVCVAGVMVGLMMGGLVLGVQAAPHLSGIDTQEEHGFSVLVFSRTVGFRHDSIPAGIAAITDLGSQHDFDVTATEDPGAFTDSQLASIDVVVFLNTTGDVLNDEQQGALERFLAQGKGFVGIHSAADTEYGWSWYGSVVGAYFDNHPQIQPAELLVEDRIHPATSHLMARWQRTDEWYNYRNNPRSDVHVLVSLNENSFSGSTMGNDHPWAWCQEVGGGRSFYTNGGHTIDSFSESEFLQHLLGGIEWAAGAQSGDCGASIGANLEKTTIDGGTQNPMDLEILPNGDVLFLERAGQVRLISASTGVTTTALSLSVALDNEDGLLGIVLDPDYASNGWIYLFYSPTGTSIQRVSRFTFDGSVLDPASEVEIMQIPVNRTECCHSAGSMAFDAQGNLFIATGDNTNPFDSGGYAPIDDRPDRAPWDARRSSGNTNDLRGKILRITPRDSGGYDVPAGNLFSPGQALTRPEIWAMGVRNPFRMSLDRQTGFVYWGDVGPDADAPNGGRGPRGYDEWNQARAPGNFGWPFCVADNQAYTNYDFATGSHSGLFDCAAPVNDSAFNTGMPVVPASVPAWIYYPYGPSPEFPAITDGPGRTAIAGPIYRPTGQEANTGLPSYFAGSFFIGEWARNWLKRVIMDDDGQVMRIVPFADQFQFLRPIALKMGPDGAFYGIEWGSGFGGNNDDSQVFRISYQKGTRAPIVRTTTSALAGPVPLTVSFDASASTDPDPGDFLSYAWDFTNDGVVDATGATAQFTYDTAGDYTALLRVTDAFDNEATRSFSITAGNTLPMVTTRLPLNGGIYNWGDTLRVEVSVTDAEDGSTDDGSIECSQVESQLSIGHDDHAHPLDVYTGCVIDIVTPSGHGVPGDKTFLFLETRYTDQAQSGASGVQGRSEVLLYPSTWEAEHYDAQSGVQLEDSADPTGGRVHLAFIEHGDNVTYRNRSLQGITHATFRVASGGSGGTITMRSGSPFGPILGQTRVPVTGGWQTFTDVTMPVTPLEGVSDIVLVFENPSSGGGLFNINRFELQGQGLTGGVETERAGLSASLYASSDFSGEAQTEVHPGASWFWGSDGVVPNAATRPASIRWEGRLVPPASGTIRLFAQSWGKARLVVDGRELFNQATENNGGSEVSGLIRAVAGQEVDMLLEYVDESGDAGVVLSWQGGGFVRRVILGRDTRLPASFGTSTQSDLPVRTDLTWLELYPNPFTDRLSARMTCMPGVPIDVTMFDVMGREVGTSRWRCSESRIVDIRADGQELAPGVYFLSVRSGSEKLTRPVVRTR